MCNSQWAHIDILNLLDHGVIDLRGASLSYGEFYDCRSGDGVSESDVDKLAVAAGSRVSVCTCGTSFSFEGMEGSLDLYDGATKICTVAWDDPWAKDNNYFGFSAYNHTSPYLVHHSSYNTGPTGPIGDVTVVVTNMR